MQYNTMFKSTTYAIYHVNFTLQGYAYVMKQCNNLHFYQFLLIYSLFLLLLMNTALQISLLQ